MLHGTALAQVAVPDFRLPPARPTATPQPERVGPVVPDVPESRATPTPSPTPAPTAQPPAVQPPLVVPPVATPTPTPAPRTVPSPASTRTAPDAPEAEPTPSAAATPAPAPTTPAAPTPGGTDAPPPLPPVAPSTPAPQADEGGVTLIGWLAIAAVLAGGALLLILRRRRRVEPTASVLPDPPPVPAPVPVPTPAPRPAPAPATRPITGLQAVELDVTAERLSLSLMNATLTFQLALRHPGEAPLDGLTIHGDLIGAHGALSQEEQLGGPAPGAPVIARLPSLSEAETRLVTGEVRLPLAQVTAIRQGQTSLFVPLLRLALEAEGQGRRTLTALVGPPGQSGQVQPVRLDAGPRVVAPLLARVLG